ncbi:MAG: hypothetical protein IH627_05185 [Rubrivivax sp.]|nr:hypothetical protein [Rubrivivax sp.]
MISVNECVLPLSHPRRRLERHAADSRRCPRSSQFTVSMNQPPSPERAAEAAIAQVLAAERAAREAMASARLEAAHIGEQSRAQVRGLAERTQRRIRRLRTAFERRTDTEVAALRAQAAALVAPHEFGSDEAARVDEAVARLAAQLTGAAP